MTLGPYTILRVVSSHAYELELPADIRIHPVQPVSLLTAVDEDPYPGQHIPPPPPVVVKGEAPEYPVESVDNSRLHHCQLQYRVRWQGWPDLTWCYTFRVTPIILTVGAALHLRIPPALKTGPRLTALIPAYQNIPTRTMHTPTVDRPEGKRNDSIR